MVIKYNEILACAAQVGPKGPSQNPKWNLHLASNLEDSQVGTNMVVGQLEKSLRQELEGLLALADKQGLPVHILLKDLGPRGHALVAMVLSLPFLLPVPLPGLSTPFGILIGLIGVAVAANRDPWLPKKIRQLRIPLSVLEQIISRSGSILKRVEKIMKPRWSGLVVSPWGQRLHGLLILLAASLLALPAPPGGNILPACAVIGFCLAILEEDGVMSLLGIVFFFGSLAFFGGLILALVETIKHFWI